MSGIRVISGSAKGRKLRPVPGEVARPVGDRVKEALFNILSGDIQGATFLDLFAGTGSVGIEALSRGAHWTLFVDNHAKAIRTIETNLDLTGLGESAEVQRRDVFHFLRSPVTATFDFVYIAPPQFKGMWKRALLTLEEKQGWLNPEALVIVQIHPKEFEALTLRHLKLVDQRKYGSTLLLFFEHPGG
jgi:16S rRNA (guanine(966)-N(2))-methyltransferase RsmD